METTTRLLFAALFTVTATLRSAFAGVGDPQIRTDHPWYPGELAISTFPRLFATQAEVYERVVGRRPVTDEDKALASWLWRNTHYAHAEEAAEDLWGQGFTRGVDMRSREYWTGLFSHGFGLCGTTHSQWAAEMEVLLGHGRGRGVGMAGHNSFEVFLTGGAYGTGKWALLDHDLSTVIFNRDGSALLSAAEVQRDWRRLADRRHAPERQRGWLVCGLHPDDGASYAKYDVAEYLPGYSGPPPMVHLRMGETMRRYFEPGLEDGRTFVFWGRNYQTGGDPGPERSHTWVNQPEKMHGSRDGAGYRPGQARYGNAVFTYQPNFKYVGYRQGVVTEDDQHVVLEFTSPYLIGATPPSDKPWGVYEAGGRNGLVVTGRGNVPVSVSIDHGATWHAGGELKDRIDLTDQVKGRRQYWLRLGRGARDLIDKRIAIRTVCQVNPATLPRLKDGGTKITFSASYQAVVSAGPALAMAKKHIVKGQFGSPEVVMNLATPRGEPITAVYAAAHVLSSNPPAPDIAYSIDTDRFGPMVKDWKIPRRGDEPGDFWSQSMCWGVLERPNKDGVPPTSLTIRFHNTGRKNYARCEAHALYEVQNDDLHFVTKVTYNWSDDAGKHESSQFMSNGRFPSWNLSTGRNVKTHWVEFDPWAQ